MKTFQPNPLMFNGPKTKNGPNPRSRVSNVPAVLMMKPFVYALKDRDTAWLVIAMASTLAGNFAVLGSIANLIVVQRAAASGVVIGFWDYFRVGAPLTIITLAIGTLWLWR